MDDQVTDRELAEEIERMAERADALASIAVARRVQSDSPTWVGVGGWMQEASEQLQRAARDAKHAMKPSPEGFRRGDYIVTFKGIRFWPLDPRVEEVELEDIAHALALRCRWGCMTSRFYSVGEHSLRVASVASALASREEARDESEVAAYALLHDAAEAYLADIPRPVKPFLREWDAIEAGVERVILERFCLPPPSAEVAEVVKLADTTLLVLEARELFPEEMWRSWLPRLDISVNVERAAHLPLSGQWEVKKLLLTRLREVLADRATPTPPRAASPASEAGSWRRELAEMRGEPPPHIKRLLEDSTASGPSACPFTPPPCEGCGHAEGVTKVSTPKGFTRAPNAEGDEPRVVVWAWLCAGCATVRA